MASRTEPSKHDDIKAEIVTACKDLGFDAIQEYRGKGWRADVLAAKNSARFAFEIQISPQSLKKTLERQEKYTRDGITGCWLFEKPPSKLSGERPDLPLFYVTKHAGTLFSVSLSGRKELPLHDFLENFLSGGMKFCQTARTKPEQHVKLVFFEMECWKCKAMNHVYYVDANFYSACNAVIQPEGTLWGSDQSEYRPEIIKVAREFVSTAQAKHPKLGEIERRFSNAVQGSYTSFGCYKCDSIFGDWFVNKAQMEAKMEAAYGHGQAATIEREVRFDGSIELPIPHWCYPGELPFCDLSQ